MPQHSRQQNRDAQEQRWLQHAFFSKALAPFVHSWQLVDGSSQPIRNSRRQVTGMRGFLQHSESWRPINQGDTHTSHTQGRRNIPQTPMAVTFMLFPVFLPARFSYSLPFCASHVWEESSLVRSHTCDPLWFPLFMQPAASSQCQIVALTP